MYHYFQDLDIQGWQEIHKERDNWEDRDVGGWKILKRILER
jgi:hypothetical protein